MAAGAGECPLLLVAPIYNAPVLPLLPVALVSNITSSVPYNAPVMPVPQSSTAVSTITMYYVVLLLCTMNLVTAISSAHYY